MSGPRTTPQTGESGINVAGGEWRGCTAPKKRRTDGNPGLVQTGERGGETTTRNNNGGSTAEREVGTRKIKEEADEEVVVQEEEYYDAEEGEDKEFPDEDESGDGFSDSFSDPGDPEGLFELLKKCSAEGDQLRMPPIAYMNRDSAGAELSWKFRSAPDVKPEPLRFNPARPAGPALDTSASWTPLSVFHLFCSASVISKVVENTNKNGARQRETGLRKKWTEITVQDLYMFLIAVVHTSVVKLHDHIDYWRKGWPFGFQFPGDAISRNNFELIRTTLSLCDPEEDDENEAKKGTPEYDKLFKIQPFYCELVGACKAYFQPHSNICVYERKAAKKQLKCGYRLFALADSSTGYTWNLHIDTGKALDTRGQAAVRNLLPVSVLGSGYTLYTDSLFSSPRLFTELLDQNIGCCGVISKHHSEFPQNARSDFSASPTRGDIRWLRKGKLMFAKWIDIREVAMCSTVHEAFTGQVIKRPVEEGEGWISKQFSCPDAVADFNRHMVGNDCEFSFCMPCTRVKCWERVLFYHLLDLAVVNSFILYKEVMKGKGQVKGLTQKDFRVMLCKEIYKFAKGCDPDARAAAAAPAADVLCMPVYYVPGNATAGRKTCKLCHTTTPIYCQKCLIPLCVKSVKNCFKEWHELEKSGKK